MKIANFAPVAYSGAWFDDNSFKDCRTMRELEAEYKRRMAIVENDRKNVALNKDIYETNAKAVQEVIKLAESLGFRVRTYKPSRGKKPGHYVNEPWVNHLTEQIPSTTYTDRYSPEAYEQRVASMKAAYSKAVERIDRSERRSADDARVRADLEAKRLLAVKIAATRGFLDQLKTTNPVEVFWLLVESNKYLRLANAMEMTRNDWSEGTHLVESALGKFSVESDLDGDIYDDVIGQVMNFEDGRQFRDCNYSYRWLYDNAIDEALLTDFNALRSLRDMDV